MSLILISNDDGIHAPGIHLLVRQLATIPDTEIVVVAPAEPHSGQSSAITVNAALRVDEHPEFSPDLANVKAFSINGTPVDCIKLSMHHIVPRRPDLVVAGINHGSNAGNSVIYSGTMGAVMEACMQGLPAVGYSLLDHSMQADFSQCLPLCDEITRKVLAKGLLDDVCLNVNFPKTDLIKGMKVVRSARTRWTEEYKTYFDPHDHPFYWLTGTMINEEPLSEETDLYWLDRNFASIVPTRPDQNATADIPIIQKSLGL